MNTAERADSTAGCIVPRALQWVRLAKIDAGDGPAGALTTEEREELTRLRREHKRVLMDLEILKKATEFFARRNL